jgi:hypothetical protein
MKVEINSKTKRQRFNGLKAAPWLAFMAIILSLTLIQSCQEEESQPDITVTSISPTSGGIRTSVEIVGAGFGASTSDNAVTLNGKICPVTSATTTKLTITIPDDGETGNFEVAVGNKTGQSGTFTVIPLAISAISPTSGAVGTLVEITGTGFGATPSENAVTLNGKVCQIINASITKLTISIPADAASGNLMVTVNAKSVQSGPFTFIPLAITGISPASGEIGTLVTITGTGFSATVSANAVTLNGKICPVVTATATSLSVTIPADATSGNLSVTVSGKTVQSSTFTVVAGAPDLVISSISPTTGAKNTVVTITGTGFSATASENAVTLNGKTCPVTNATVTALTITIPAEAGSGSITVAVGGKAAQSSTFTFIPDPPEITAISPTSGPKNTVVTITGTGFSATASENIVTLNSKVCPVTSATTTTLTITIPADAGSGNITVAVGGNTAQSSLFTFIPDPTPLSITSISPDTGPKNTVVTITGTGFSAVASENAVTLNSKVCPVTSATATTLTITIPTDAGSGNINVTVGGNTVQSSLFTFIPDTPLAITSISPTTGPKNTVVTITGTGFSTSAANNAVTLNNKPCPVTNATETQLTVTIPAGAGSGVLKVTKDGTTVQSQTFDFVFTTTVSTFAGSGQDLSNDGTGTSANIGAPRDAVFDASGNLYVTDGYHRIRKITPTGEVTTFAGSGYGDDNGTGTSAQFKRPMGMAVDGSGNLYVAEEEGRRIRKITSSGVVSTLAGSGDYDFAEGTGTAAKFRNPTGVVVDASGNVFVADKDNHRIRKIISASGEVTTFAGSTEGSADGNGTAAQFKKPFDAVFDANGNMYVTDESDHRIRKITPAGAVTTFAGSSYGFQDGPGNTAQFQFIKGIAIDGNGNLYVADENSHRIRKITPAGVVSTLAGTGSEGSTDGEGSAAEFRYPTGVAVDASGNVYVADKDNHKIRKITID